MVFPYKPSILGAHPYFKKHPFWNQDIWKLTIFNSFCLWLRLVIYSPFFHLPSWWIVNVHRLYPVKWTCLTMKFWCTWTLGWLYAVVYILVSSFIGFPEVQMVSSKFLVAHHCNWLRFTSLECSQCGNRLTKNGGGQAISQPTIQPINKELMYNIYMYTQL